MNAAVEKHMNWLTPALAVTIVSMIVGGSIYIGDINARVRTLEHRTAIIESIPPQMAAMQERMVSLEGKIVELKQDVASINTLLLDLSRQRHTSLRQGEDMVLR